VGALSDPGVVGVLRAVRRRQGLEVVQNAAAGGRRKGL